MSLHLSKDLIPGLARGPALFSWGVPGLEGTGDRNKNRGQEQEQENRNRNRNRNRKKAWNMGQDAEPDVEQEAKQDAY